MIFFLSFDINWIYRHSAVSEREKNINEAWRSIKEEEKKSSTKWISTVNEKGKNFKDLNLKCLKLIEKNRCEIEIRMVITNDMHSCENSIIKLLHGELKFLIEIYSQKYIYCIIVSLNFLRVYFFSCVPFHKKLMSLNVISWETSNRFFFCFLF